jgi:uracil-DNA glycosylase
MSWTERQAQMLQAMGLRLWSAATPGMGVTAAPAVTAEAEAEVEVKIAAVPMPKPVAPVPVPMVLPPALPVVAPMVRDPAIPVAGLGWEDLRHAVSECRACGLCEGRTQTVFGNGHLHAHWLIVGEAPGEQEDVQGEPFVGRSGQLLNGMLHALGLSRRDDGEPSRSVYITNTLKCRPPSNRNPQPQEMQRCAPFLHRQIDLLQPRVVLAMGRSAAQALLNDDAPLGQLRGRVHQRGRLPVVVTYHPSYLLRSPGEKFKTWADLCLASDTADTAGTR